MNNVINLFSLLSFPIQYSRIYNITANNIKTSYFSINSSVVHKESKDTVVVRYIGATEFESGLWIGVQFNGPKG